MATIYQLGSGKWRAQVRLRGAKPVSKVFAEKEDAEAWAAELEEELAPKKIAYSGDKTFSEVFDLYKKMKLEGAIGEVKAKSTIRTELQKSVVVLKELGAEGIRTITTQRLQQYFDYRSTCKRKDGKKIAGDTIRLEKALISNVFKFACSRGMAEFNPAIATRYELPKPNERIIRIEAEDQGKLLNAAQVEYKSLGKTNRSLYPWLLLITLTGMRPGEAAKIKTEWVKKAQIELPPEGVKNRESRIVLLEAEKLYFPIYAQLQKAMAAGSEYLFWSVKPKTKEIIPFQYHHPYKRLCQKAGVKYVVPHGIRHEFVSRAFENTDLETPKIARIAGYKHLHSMKRYEHIKTERLRDVAEDLQLDHLTEILKAAKPKK